MKYFLVILIYSISVYASCNKQNDCINQGYSFVTYLKAYQDVDSIFVNDTIWLDFSCPTSLFDTLSDRTVDYSKAQLSLSFDFLEFTGGSVSNPGVIPAVNAFDYKLIQGVFLPDDLSPDKNRDYAVLEANNEYKFKLGVVPKRVGIFAIVTSNASNVYRQTDNCTKAFFKITFANTNQHLYFYEQNRPGYTPSQYEREHMYCFKVK